jgi:hypothetical protein
MVVAHDNLMSFEVFLMFSVATIFEPHLRTKGSPSPEHGMVAARTTVREGNLLSQVCSGQTKVYRWANQMISPPGR